MDQLFLGLMRSVPGRAQQLTHFALSPILALNPNRTAALLPTRTPNPHRAAELLHTLTALQGCSMCPTGLEAAEEAAAMAIRLASDASAPSREDSADPDPAPVASRSLLTEQSVTALMLLLTEARGHTVALSVLQSLQAAGVRPGLNPYNCVLCRCARDGDLDGVLEVFGLLRLQAGIRLDKYTYR